MNILIIDDDISFLKKLEEKVMQEFVNVSYDTFTTLPPLSNLKNNYSIIILDILINKENGIIIAKDLKNYYPQAHIVFISNHKDLIFNTQILNPLCFIRKTHLDNDFFILVQLLAEYKIKNKIITIKASKDYRNNEVSIKKINTEEIVYVESNNHKIQIHTFKEEISAYMNLKELYKTIEDCNCFIQVHKTFIINMAYVKEIKKDSVILTNINHSKNTVSIGRKYKKNFIEKYEEFILL